MKKPKVSTVSSLKKKAWRLFSLYIRQRDATSEGYVRCVSCGVMKHWKQGDAGHFIDGRRNSILFDPRNCHFQCKGCNGNLRDGNISRNQKDIKNAYFRFMKQKYGLKVIRELERKNKEHKQFSVNELEGLIGELKEKLLKKVVHF